MEKDSELLPGKFAQALLIASKYLSKWLKTNFSTLDGNWWGSLVLPALSYQQKQWVDRNPVPAKGLYTIKVFVKYKKLLAEKSIKLTIK